MNSTFLIRSLQTGICKQRTLVYPDNNFKSGICEYINIYDPMGLSRIGYQQNDIFDIQKDDKNGRSEDRLVIEKILFQSEAMQLYNL